MFWAAEEIIGSMKCIKSRSTFTRCADWVENKKGLHAEAGKPLILLLNTGADCRFRTGHLMITNQLLYQMS